MKHIPKLILKNNNRGIRFYFLTVSIIHNTFQVNYTQSNFRRPYILLLRLCTVTQKIHDEADKQPTFHGITQTHKGFTIIKENPFFIFSADRISFSQV